MNYEVISNNKTNNGVIFCLGFFDGMHLGHQELVKETLRLAKLYNKKAGLVTFINLPSTKEDKRHNKCILLSNEDKKKIINNYKLDEIVFLKFDAECKSTSKTDFVSFLKNKLNCSGVVVGKDYRFGYKGEGDAEYLLSLNNDDFIVSIVEPFCIDNEIVSTTKIIKFLEEGKIELANKCLGRPYYFEGIVKEGFHVGKTLDFPTANIDFSDDLVIPLYGVYAVKIHIDDDDKEYYGISNIGIRPSINTLKKPLLETHIFDFNETIYQKKIKVELLHFIRCEIKFNSINELKEQINKDKKKALAILL